MPRPCAALSVLLIAFAALTTSGCAPEPRPPRTAAFASDEEAFAAAEKVYRAYDKAGNARIAGKSSPDPQDYLIGEALEADIDGVRDFDEQGLRLSGEGAVASFIGLEADLNAESATVTALACLQVTGIRLLDATGADVTPAERPDVVAQSVEFSAIDGGLRISAESAADADRC